MNEYREENDILIFNYLYGMNEGIHLYDFISS